MLLELQKMRTQFPCPLLKLLISLVEKLDTYIYTGVQTSAFHPI